MFCNVFGTQKEKLIYDVIHEAVEAMSYNIVRIRMTQGKKRHYLQIMIEKDDYQPVCVADCEKVSKEVSVLLDVYGPVGNDDYNIEISSCGINRPLTTIADFEKFMGHKVKLRTWRRVEGQGNFMGLIDSITSDSLCLKLQSCDDSISSFAFDNIKEICCEHDFGTLQLHQQKKQMNKKQNKRQKRRHLKKKNGAKGGAKGAS